MEEKKAVLVTLIDFSKAFNRVNHNIVLKMLSEMGVPGWLLRIVASFLTKRKLIVRYKGMKSTTKAMPGGGPQGSTLGCFVFLILINFAGLDSFSEPIGKHITQSLPKRKPIPQTQAKFVDDMTMGIALNLEKTLIKDPDPNPVLPLNFHNRTGHILPRDNNIMQKELDGLITYVQEKEMKVNVDKTKVMLFNTKKSLDFMPQLFLGTESELDVVESTKLLEIIIRSDIKWIDNTEFICKRPTFGYTC